MNGTGGGYWVAGRTVLVTGAAGDIGRAIASAFLERGAHVHLTDVATDALGASAKVLSASGGVTSGVCDLSDADDVEALCAGAIARHGHIDVLVNNAAIQPDGAIDDCSPDDMRDAWAVNVQAPYLLARALVPGMRTAGGGAIVNLTSVHATAPGPRRLAYATTKTALLGMTRSLAVDLGRDGIRVNAVSPGATLTGQLKEVWRIDQSGADPMDHAIRQHPLGRIADVSDVAGAVVYLAEAPFVSGIELRVDGGFLSALRLRPQD